MLTSGGTSPFVTGMSMVVLRERRLASRFYFPPKEQYQGRFFQHNTPFPSSEKLEQQSVGEDDKIGFSIASGAYFIETNEGGSAVVGASDPAVAGYLVNAAAARYSEKSRRRCTARIGPTVMPMVEAEELLRRSADSRTATPGTGPCPMS